MIVLDLTAIPLYRTGHDRIQPCRVGPEIVLERVLPRIMLMRGTFLIPPPEGGDMATLSFLDFFPDPVHSLIFYDVARKGARQNCEMAHWLPSLVVAPPSGPQRPTGVRVWGSKSKYGKFMIPCRPRTRGKGVG